MTETRLLDRVRAMIDRPGDFSQAEVCTLLKDAGEVIVMLQRVIARHVRDQRSHAGATEGM